MNEEGINSATLYINKAFQVGSKNAELYFFKWIIIKKYGVGRKDKTNWQVLPIKQAYRHSNALGMLYGSYKLKIRTEAYQFLTNSHMLNPKSVYTLYWPIVLIIYEIFLWHFLPYVRGQEI